MADSLEGLEELEGLRRAVHRLGRMDPGVLGDDELHALVIELQKERARLGAAAAELLSCSDARRLWAGDGSRSAAARLSRETSTSLASAAVEMRRARQLRSMPTCAAAIADGSLALDHVDLLGRANQPHRAACFARDERFLVDQVSRVRFAQAVKIVEYWCRRADAATGHDDGEEPAAGAELQVSRTWDGTVAIDGMLDPVGGAIVADELGRLEHGLSQADQRDGVTRTAKQRRAAALVIMAQRSATTPAEGRRPRPLFTVLLGHDTFADLCELANGIVITPRHLVPWLGTAELETILFDGPSTVVSVSRRRSFTGAVRRAVEVRDRHCQHPAGCDVPADRCDVDHIVPYSSGGLTSQFNGRLECAAHNRHHDLHDHGADPRPSRPIARLDELRARLRWRFLHEERHSREPPSLASADSHSFGTAGDAPFRAVDMLV